MYFDHEGKSLEAYSKAPLEVLHDKKLKDFSKLLYFEMYSVYDQNKKTNDYIFTKDETLAVKMSVSVSYVERALKNLEDNKYIKRVTTNFSKEKKARKRVIYFRQLKRNDNSTISYVEFPKSLYTQNLSGTSKLILIEFLSLSSITENDLGHITISNQVLADRFKKGRRTIIRSINQLQEQRLIIVEISSGNIRYIYLEESQIWSESFKRL